MFKRSVFMLTAVLSISTAVAPPAQAQQVGDIKHHAGDRDTEICITLYEQCRTRTNNGYKCAVCLGVCQANQGEWPFQVCPFPRGLRGADAKGNQKCSPLLSGLAESAQ